MSQNLQIVPKVVLSVFAWDIECMNPKPLHPDVLEFVSSLQKLETILLKYEQEFWAVKLSRVRQIAENSNGYSVQYFESLFGGTGSFNDVVLEAPASANRDFATERTRAYELAQALK
jgi:flagellar motor switch protein FliN/FliY